ncbi:cysteine protease [Clostridia bacterium]|nr:cysteine protease [Clostridia bacterium]
MICVSITQSLRLRQKKKAYFLFEIKGHAGYGTYGKDIVCAGVSALVFNFFHSVQHLTQDRFWQKALANQGVFRFAFSCPPSKEARLLLKSLFLGLFSIQKTYGSKYLQIQLRRDKGVE